MTPPGAPGQQDDGSGGRDDAETTLAGGLGRYAGHGLTIALSTALFAWLGSWADDRLGTGPALVLAGVFVGFGAGFYSMMRALGVVGGNEEDGASG